MIFLGLIAVTVAAAPAPADARCRPPEPELATAGPVAGFHRLDRLPPAAHVLTVYRKVDGCPTPVVLREGIGSDRLASPAR